MDQTQLITPSELEAAAHALITARTTNLGVEVQMPLIYPNGQSVTVIVNVEGGQYVVHDAGLGSMSLTNAGMNLNRELIRRLAHLAQYYGCDFIEGRMTRRCTPEQVALAMVMVANASRTVGDQIHDMRARPLSHFHRELADVMTSVVGSERVRKVDVSGYSGTSYRVNAVYRNSEVQAFVEAITDHEAVNRQFREFYDLKESDSYSEIDRLAVYDDRKDWKSGDLTLLNTVGNVVPFSIAPQRLRQLANAA